MKKLLLFVGLLCSATVVFSQKKLSIKDVTPELSVYPCQDRYEALVVIRCSEEFELEFKSNVDKELNITREKEGSEAIYNIVFKTREEGTSFKGRMLSIMAPSFDKLYLPLELKQKEKKEYIVSDPYSSLRSIFYTSLEKGNELFSVGMYDQAKDQYHIAQRCPEYKDFENRIDEYITLCDSMTYWTAIVDTAEARGDYYRAKAYLEKMSYKNTNCTTLRERYYNIQQAYATRCNADMANGLQYMLDGYYEKAKKTFQNAVDMRSPRTGEAELKLHEIEKLTFKKTNRTRTFFYQYTDNLPLGFTYANCNPTKTGGYFSMGLNKQCFDLLTNVNKTYSDVRLDYEVAVSAGWVVPIFRSYVFANFTPFSYSGGGYSLTKVGNAGNTDNGQYGSNSETNVIPFLNQNIQWYNAVSPEIGIIVKYWHVALNYKFQYRYWIGQNENMVSRLGSTSHSIGIGFAW